jgi:CRISPR-associated protein Csb1
MPRSGIPALSEEALMSELTTYDAWLTEEGPAALVLREPLVPVEGPDGVLFPATFAAAEDKTKFAGGYNIDVFPDTAELGAAAMALSKGGSLKPTIDLFPNSKNVCLVDSVGSQANRIEPLFARSPYAELVPQVVIRAGDKAVNLLEAGHRAGDAIIRCSALKGELQAAFKQVLAGNVGPLAKIAPTSLVFGVWDSRDTQAKLPRLVASTIRAFNVRKLSRSAQYIPAAEYVGQQLLAEPTEKKDKDAYAERGFIHVPASGSHGGVIATGGARRDATLSFAALRLLAVREADGSLSTDRTQALRRYVLGLALTALTAKQATYLRQGCNLVPDPDKPRELKIVHADGRREDAAVTHPDALAYATAAAKAFGVGEGRTVEFDRVLAEKDVKGSEEKLKGEIVAVDEEAKKFTLRTGQRNQKKDSEVATTDGTMYLKGEDASTFEEVVVRKAKVEVELAQGAAAKVTAKKK